MTSVGGVSFLERGGTPQQRYEALRSRWVAPDAPGLLAILRMPWGRRLFHFGVLGLLDEDPTGGGRFTMASQARAVSVSAGAASTPRCARMVLDTLDSESRLREAYRWVLMPSAAPRHAVGERYE